MTCLNSDTLCTPSPRRYLSVTIILEWPSSCCNRCRSLVCLYTLTAAVCRNEQAGGHWFEPSISHHFRNRFPFRRAVFCVLGAFFGFTNWMPVVPFHGFTLSEE